MGIYLIAVYKIICGMNGFERCVLFFRGVKELWLVELNISQSPIPTFALALKGNHRKP